MQRAIRPRSRTESRPERRGAVRAVVVLAVVVLALGSCARPQVEAEAVTLARYRGGEVTRAEFDAHLASRAQGAKSLIEGEGDWRVTVLKGLAVTEITAQAAPESPQLDRSIEQATGAILEARMIERLGWDEISVSAEEVQSYYEEHLENFVEPEKLRLQHIFLRASEGALSAEERARIRQRLEGIHQQILDGADFAAMAREHSDSADGAGGGWMVLKRGARAVRSFTQVAWSLKENEVSEVIDTPTGFQIARLAARVAPVEPRFEDLRQFAGAEAQSLKRRQREEAFLAEKGPLYGFERRHEALENQDAGDDTVLFYLAGAEFTVRDMLATANETYRSHYYAGYLEELPRLLDRQAMERVLILEARAENLESDDTVSEEIGQASQAARANFEIERRLTERNRATAEEDLIEFYELNKNRYETPRMRSLSVIRLAREEGRSLREMMEEGARLVEAIRAGVDFAVIARQRSDHFSAAAGGRLLDLSDEEVRMQVQAGARGGQVIDELSEGKVSNAFVGEVYAPHKARFEPTGVYIVRLDDDTMPRQAPFDEVRDRVRLDFLERNRTRLLAELQDDILGEAQFEIVEANLPGLGG